MTQTVRRIEAVAHLEDQPEGELDRAREEAEAGDASWRQWLDQYEEGAAMLLRLDVSLHVDLHGGEERMTLTNHSLWVEDHAHPPKVEQQIAELAHKDFPAFARALRDRGLELGVTDLEEMFVAVTLGDDVLAQLGSKRSHQGEAIDSTTGLTTRHSEVEPQ